MIEGVFVPQVGIGQYYSMGHCVAILAYNYYTCMLALLILLPHYIQVFPIDCTQMIEISWVTQLV